MLLKMLSRNASIIVKRLASTAIGLAHRTPVPVFGVEGRYVSALYSAAAEKKELEECEKTLGDLQKVLSKPGVQDFIETSMISAAEKAKILGGIAKEAGMPSTAVNFLELVAENNRLKKLRKMLTMFMGVMVAHRKEALCEVITAEPLSSAHRSALMEALKKIVKDGKNITLTERVDESIIGGLVVGIEDKHIDMSVARKIQMYTEILKQSV